MSNCRLVLEGRLPSLNDYTKACRTNRYAGATMKKAVQADIIWAIQQQLPQRIETPIELRFEWYEKNERRDQDNIAFAKKFILDALVNSGRIKDDGWRYVKGFVDRFYIDNEHPRIEVYITVGVKDD